MKNHVSLLIAIALMFCIVLGPSGCNRSDHETAGTAPTASNSPPADTNLTSSSQLHFTDPELDELVAPIALYPDPLLAQVVPASTFIDQLEEASRTLGGKSDDSLIADQKWEVSVKSVAHYPQVLQMMVEKRDWTTALGQAYVNQPKDLNKAIQRMRADAQEVGNLLSTPEQQVIDDGQVIKIEPAQPKLIYVPQYNPEVVYVEKGPSTGEKIAAGLITFGAGLAIGAWLNNDYNYYGPGPYYHGWVGPGWIGVNRTFVNVNRNVYVNNSYRNINVNRNIVNRNVSTYRTNLTRNATVRSERINASNVRRNVNVAGTRNVDRAKVGASDRGRVGTVDRGRVASGDRGRNKTGSNARTGPNITKREPSSVGTQRVNKGNQRTAGTREPRTGGTGSRSSVGGRRCKG